MLCMCTRSTTRSFARASVAKIVRSRDAQCIRNTEGWPNTVFALALADAV